MERRAARVSEVQWSILLEFLERHPSLARARGYNNSIRGRAESTRLWQEVADVLNAEGSGSTKTAKEWSIVCTHRNICYCWFFIYKSKLKKTVAVINSDITTTGGGPPQGSSLSDVDNRFLALMGPGFGQTAPQVSVNPFPDAELQQQPPPSTTSAMPDTQDIAADDVQYEIIELSQTCPAESEPTVDASATLTAAGAEAPTLPRRTRRSRYHSRPLAPLDEARRILSQVEMKRAEADAERARALHLIGQNLGRIANVAERYLSHFETQ